MASSIIGSLPQTQPDGDTLTMDEMGGGEATLTKIYKASTFTLSLIPPPLSAHPEYSTLKLYTATVERMPGDLKKLVLTYKGVLLSNAKVYMVEEAQRSTSSEPIETAPLFYDGDAAESKIKPEELAAIKRALDANQPYDDINKFKNATKLGIKLYKKMALGITNWLRSGTQYSQTFIQGTIPKDYSGVGTIESPRDGNPPRAPKGQNYLYTGMTWRKEGGRVTVTKEYLLSGRKGWDKEIYGKGDKKDGLTTGGLRSGGLSTGNLK